VADKSNEITAIPLLVRLLDLKGCLVTIDAMGCQNEIVNAVTGNELVYQQPAAEGEAICSGGAWSLRDREPAARESACTFCRRPEPSTEEPRTDESGDISPMSVVDFAAGHIQQDNLRGRRPSAGRDEERLRQILTSFSRTQDAMALVG
jgi:predicted transposase YbfD/YdcC